MWTLGLQVVTSLTNRECTYLTPTESCSSSRHKMGLLQVAFNLQQVRWMFIAAIRHKNYWMHPFWKSVNCKFKTRKLRVPLRIRILLLFCDTKNYPNEFKGRIAFLIWLFWQGCLYLVFVEYVEVRIWASKGRTHYQDLEFRRIVLWIRIRSDLDSFGSEDLYLGQNDPLAEFLCFQEVKNWMIFGWQQICLGA